MDKKTASIFSPCLLYLCLVAFLPGCMNHLFYKPDQVIYQPPGTHEDVFFRTADGVKLHGQFFPAVRDEFGTVIHFHGNYGNISYSLKQTDWLPGEGFNVFTFDYRGYGKSDGVPSRRGLYSDSIAAVEYVMSQTDIDTENLFIFGQSLGGANAIAAIAKNNFSGIRAVVVEGTFSSYRQEVRDMMAAEVRKNIGNIPCLSLQLWPVSFLMITDELSPLDFIGLIAPIPVLVIHGTQDDKVLYYHAQKIYKKAGEPKYLWTVSNGHLTTFTGEVFSDVYRKRLVEFFKKYRKSE